MARRPLLRLPRLLSRTRLTARPTTRVTARYAPNRNGLPDPGEVVWAWVPYEDDPRQGKDRPVLVVAVKNSTVIGLALTSKDHDHDAEQERRAGRVWMDVGTGEWDQQRRPSEVRVNRFLILDASDVRREGGAMPRATFDRVVETATPYLPEVSGKG